MCNQVTTLPRCARVISQYMFVGVGWAGGDAHWFIMVLLEGVWNLFRPHDGGYHPRVFFVIDLIWKSLQWVILMIFDVRTWGPVEKKIPFTKACGLSQTKKALSIFSIYSNIGRGWGWIWMDRWGVDGSVFGERRSTRASGKTPHQW